MGDTTSIKSVIAKNLSWLRTERRITLSELARRCGVAKATLSKLEAGWGNPTLETLRSIAGALDVALGALLAEDDLSVRVARADEGAWVTGKSVDGRLLDRLLSAAAVELWEIVVHADAVHRKSGKAPGAIDYVFVTEGRLRVGPADEPVELGSGDFIRFASDQPYVFEALGGTSARAVQVISYAETSRRAKADGDATRRVGRPSSRSARPRPNARPSLA
ncbi:MAG: helix-turn-helix domain-containing protein [Dehalococcoidia bacterium]